MLQAPAKPSFHTRCIFTEGGVKCGDRIVPCSKYCRKHILEDKKQVLFRACNIEKAGVICKEPLPSIFEDATCALHIQLPPQRNYAQKKYESDSDDDTKSVASTSNIKIEDQSQASGSDEKMIEPKIECDEVTAPVEDGGTNVTICHDSNEQKTTDIEVNMKKESVESMEH